MPAGPARAKSLNKRVADFVLHGLRRIERFERIAKASHDRGQAVAVTAPMDSEAAA